MGFIGDIIEWIRTLVDSIAALIFSKAVKFNTTGISIYVHETKESIGEGAYSTVLKGFRPFHVPKYYAVKKMLAQTRELENVAVIEIESFRKFRHKNIMRLIDSTRLKDPTGSKAIYLLFPYLENGSLRDYLNKVIDGVIAKPSLTAVLHGFLEINQALNVLHTYDPPYVHQDIKPENILIGSDGTTYLIDFGSVREATVQISSRRDAIMVSEEAAMFCTASYRSPELYDPPRDAILDTRTDVWAMGCLLYAWWFGYSPFESEFYGMVLKVVDCTSLRVLSSIPQSSNPSSDDRVILSLVEWMLEKDFMVRPYTTDVIERVRSTLQISGCSDGNTFV